MKTTFSFLVLSFALATGALSLPSAAEKIKFGTAVRVSPLYSLPLLAAEEKGFWKENGLDLEWVPFRVGAPMHQAVAAGSIEMGLSGVLSQVQAVVAGVPEVIIADMGAREDFYVWVLAGSPIREAKDLRGAKIGVSRFGGGAHAYARMVVRALGLEGEARFVAEGGFTEGIAALKSGKIDAKVTDPLSMAPLKLKGEFREVLSVRDYLPKDWIDLVIFARNDMVQRRPEATKAALKAMLQSADYVLKNRPWAVERMKSFLGFSGEVANLVYPEITYTKDGKVNSKAIANVVNFLVEYGIIPREKAPSVDMLYTAQFTR